jgi:hypothetical protein
VVSNTGTRSRNWHRLALKDKARRLVTPGLWLKRAKGFEPSTITLKLVMQRLLARLFSRPNQPWVLKGGYAMELRFRPRARTTRDIDLTCASDGQDTLSQRLIAIRDRLQEAAEVDLGDFLTFRINAPSSELTGAPLGGARFPCEAMLPRVRR